jgi:pyrroline-5-carboxylate reductase
MGRAMLCGLVRGRPELGQASRIHDVVDSAAADGAAEVDGTVGTLAQAAACDLVVLAVKPGDAAAALRGIEAARGPDTVVVSVVTGWSLDRLNAEAPLTRIARTMPNLAVRHGAGLVALADLNLAPDDAQRVRQTLAPLGTVVPLPETLFAAATALAGSGPGLLAVIAEAMEEGAVCAGLSRAQARSMTQAVLAGTAALLEDGTDPAVLRQRVSSPAGTTLAGIAVLERGSVRAHMADAVVAAARRAAEL